MAETNSKPNTIKHFAKKVADNGDSNDYKRVPIGADSDNVDRPDGSTVEESLSKIEFDKVEILPVETLPESDIKEYPYIYALVKPNESKGTLYEYRNGKWIPYGNSSNGIWVGTRDDCARDFDNIEEGTIVIIIKKDEGSEDSDTHTHDYVCQITNAPTYSEPGTKTYTCFLCGNSYTEEIPALVDSINPAGVIRIGNNEYATWKDTISFETYTNQSQTVTIEASDNETGVKEIAYHLANTGVSDSNIGTVTWTPYTAPFTIEPNNNYIVYAKITDNADNVSYICSDGIVLDNIPPVFDGMEDGGTYPTGTVLTVEEGATLTVNGEAVELVNNTYTFNELMDNCVLSISDRAGNSNTISIIFKDFIDFKLTANNLSMAGISNTGDVVIPATFEYEGNNYKTTSIGNYAFKNCTSLTSITIPDNVTDIGIGAFSCCTSLTSIHLPNNPKITIIEELFNGCSALSDVNIPYYVEVISYIAFQDCISLTSITIPDNVKDIYMSAFSGCTSLTLTIPDNVRNIGSNAFSNVPHIYYNGSATGSPWGALAIN